MGLMFQQATFVRKRAGTFFFAINLQCELNRGEVGEVSRIATSSTCCEINRVTAKIARTAASLASPFMVI